MEESLGDAFPKAIARAKTILGYYEEIGPVGMFGAAMIKQTITAAEKAWAEQDIVAMIRLYHELMEIKE